jgi:hypothetical protein
MDDDGIWLVSVMDDDLAYIVGYPISGPDLDFLGGARGSRTPDLLNAIQEHLPLIGLPNLDLALESPILSTRPLDRCSPEPSPNTVQNLPIVFPDSRAK